jgi:hypothetical protein
VTQVFGARHYIVVALQKVASRPRALARSETDTEGLPNIQAGSGQNPKFGIPVGACLYIGSQPSFVTAPIYFHMTKFVAVSKYTDYYV